MGVKAMNRPVRSRNLALVLALTGLSGLFVALSGIAPDALGPVGFFAVGMIATPVGAILALMGYAEVRAMRRLARGEDRVAGWRVTPEEWIAFVALNAKWEQEKGVFPNSLDLRQAPRAEGVEIVATPYSVRVGEEFHDLGSSFSTIHGVRWLATEPAALELLGWVRTKSSSYPRALRIPVSAAEPKEAIDLHGAWSHRFLLRNAGSGLFRNPVKARNVSLAVCVLGMAVAAAPFRMADLPLTQLLFSNLYGPMLAFGFVAAMLGGFAVLIYHFRDSKRYRAFLQGAGVRWTVSPADWGAFLAFDRVRSAEPNSAINFVSLPRPVPDAGMEIIVQEQGVMVGGEMFLFSVMATGGKLQPFWLDGPPLCLEVWAVFVTNGSSGSCTLRFPVDPALRNALEPLCEKWRSVAAPGG